MIIVCMLIHQCDFGGPVPLEILYLDEDFTGFSPPQNPDKISYTWS